MEIDGKEVQTEPVVRIGADGSRDKLVTIKESELSELEALLGTYKEAILGHEERIAALEAAVALLVVKGRKAAKASVAPPRMDIPKG